MNDMILKKCLTGLLLFACVGSASAQIIRAGIKAGPQLSWVAMDDPAFKSVAEVHPIVGFNVGGVVQFKVMDRYFLNTELIYSQKGKTVTGKIDPNLKDKVVYHHIDVPILFAMHFKGKVSDSRQFKWYINAGPNISYWLGGHGTINAGDLIENRVPPLDYKIKFGTRPDYNNPDILYIKDANRLQFGMNVGGGILLEPAPKQKVMIDFRYEIGHTRIGTPTSSDFIIPSDYQDSLKGRNKGIRLSVVYMFEFNSSKQAMNKGKSTKKIK